MTGDLRRNVEEMRIVNEDCNCSVYTMAAVAGCLLLCIGIVVYALLCG